MTPLSRRVAVTMSCLAVPVVLHAQRAPSAADVRTRLHSSVPLEVAWAAFDAATFQIREVAPDLIAVLGTPPEAEPRSRDYLIAGVLDALIQLQGTHSFPANLATPQPGVLERYHERWPVQTLILISAAGPQPCASLERWLRSARSGLEWFAIANVLLRENPSPHGFAADLLNGVKPTLSISVSDDGLAGFGSGSFAAGVVDGIGENPRGFPPHAVYEFESESIGSTVLSTGPRTTCYSRRVTTEFQFGLARRIEGWPTIDNRLAYVNALVAVAIIFSSGNRRRSTSNGGTSARCARRSPRSRGKLPTSTSECCVH
jgi:hypothetical protein